ncbi:MAG: hypothetical protein RBR97_16490 [Bacteroidales bacterium]|nr:hypothetical protein [Bacteroidales bacterium]MDY0143485.1 hypothetical protein [Bacteroidales bacterium]
MKDNSFMGCLKSLDARIRKLLRVIGIVFSIVLSPVLCGCPFSYYFNFNIDTFIMILVAGLSFVGFWIFVRIVLSIIDRLEK